MITKFLLMAVAFAPAATPTQPAAPIMLAPAGAWKIEYLPYQCRLHRQFVAGADPYDLAITFDPVVANAWLRLGHHEKPSEFGSGDTQLAVDSSGTVSKIHYNYVPAGKDVAVREFQLLKWREQIGDAQRALTLQTEAHGTYNFNVEGFSKAIAAIDACLDDLHGQLGVDPALLKTVAQQPDGNPLKNITIPERAFNITLLYWVSDQGRVFNCRVLVPSGNKSFDKKVCEQMEKRSTFVPAMSRDGKPISAPVFDAIRLRRAIVRTGP